jgi:predicted amidohydrolase
MDAVAEAVARAGVVAIVGSERVTARGREIVSVVLGPGGERVGAQVKTQIDPSEEADYVPGTGRRTFTAGGLTFGVAICHEAFRYPEIARSLVLAGASVLFVPHYVTTDDGSLPARWCDARNPYNEKALLCRALENTVFVAQANVAGPDQGSATCVVAPDGAWVAGLPYGAVGVVAADVETDRADGRIARRWAPGRSLVGTWTDAGEVPDDDQRPPA